MENETKEVERQLAVVSPDVEGTVRALEAFRKLKTSVLGPDDTIVIEKKPFIKRSGWRKISLAFNISTEIISVEREKTDTDYIVRVRARATAPNGRVSEGIAACSRSEFSGKREKMGTIHNIEATASTRAINRAVSDLVGGGEVSAEEIITEQEAVQSSTTQEQPSVKKEDITPKQKSTLINMMASDDRKKDWVEFQLKKMNKENIQLLTKAEASDILEVVLSADFPEKSNTPEFKAYLDSHLKQ